MIPKDIVTSIPLLASLPAEEAEAVLAGLDRRRLDDGAICIREGEEGDELYIVVSGEIEIIKALDSDDERLLHVGGRGTVVGEMNLLDPTATRTATVRARGATELLVVTRPAFEEVIARYPGASLAMLQTLSRRLRRTDNATIEDLRRKNRELDKAYAELKAAQQRLVEQEVLASELRNARTIQQQMLPGELPQIEGVEIAATMVPARMIGGDLYDVINIEPDRLALVIGDVAGKGIPAALYMAQVSSLLRAAAATGLPPAEVLGVVNGQLTARDMDSMFVTLLYLELNHRQRTLTIARAGHDSPLIWHRAGMLALPAPARSLALGLIHDPPLDLQTVTLPPAATVLAVTDGVTEAMDPSGEMFGHRRLAAVIENVAGQPARAICRTIGAAVDAHLSGGHQSDDITVLALQVQ